MAWGRGLRGSIAPAVFDELRAEQERAQKDGASGNTTQPQSTPPTQPQQDKDTMNINNAFPSKWIKSGDIEGDDLVLTIKSVQIETVGQGEDAEEKPIVYFSEIEKGMVLNKTNADSISRLYGPETDGWTGKTIALFATEVAFGGKQTLALRVRLKTPTKSNGNAPIKASGMTIAEAEQAWNDHPSHDTWKAFCAAIGATPEQVNATFKSGVSSWMKANGKTSAEAAKALADYIAF